MFVSIFFSFLQITLIYFINMDDSVSNDVLAHVLSTMNEPEDDTIADAMTSSTLSDTLSASFEEIQTQLKQVLDRVEQGAILKAFELLSGITDAVVTNCETLGLTSDDPPYTMIDRDGFWQGLNQCWLFALSHCSLAKSEEERLKEQHMYHLRDSVVSWCDILEHYGLVDYEMGFWEQDILEAIEAGISALRLMDAATSTEDDTIAATTTATAILNTTTMNDAILAYSTNSHTGLDAPITPLTVTATPSPLTTDELSQSRDTPPGTAIVRQWKLSASVKERKV
jgi:hypothetical protein